MGSNRLRSLDNSGCQPFWKYGWVNILKNSLVCKYIMCRELICMCYKDFEFSILKICNVIFGGCTKNRETWPITLKNSYLKIFFPLCSSAPFSFKSVHRTFSKVYEQMKPSSRRLFRILELWEMFQNII